MCCPTTSLPPTWSPVSSWQSVWSSVSPSTLCNGVVLLCGASRGLAGPHQDSCELKDVKNNMWLILLAAAALDVLMDRLWNRISDFFVLQLQSWIIENVDFLRAACWWHINSWIADGTRCSAESTLSLSALTLRLVFPPSVQLFLSLLCQQNKLISYIHSEYIGCKHITSCRLNTGSRNSLTDISLFHHLLN